MSITLGDYSWTSKKTVGDTSGTYYNDIESTPPCEQTIDIDDLQPTTKIIKQFDTITLNSAFNGVDHEITAFVPFPDDYFMNGYDYILELTMSTTPNVLAAPNAIKFCPNYTSDPLTDIYYSLTALTASLNTFQINENICGGDYMSAARFIDVNLSNAVTFDLSIDITIKQLISASMIIEQCNGVFLEVNTELDTEIIEETTYTNEGVEQTSEIIKRKTSYNPTCISNDEWNFIECQKINRGSCISYQTYYKGAILFEPYINSTPPNKVYLDTGIYQLKIDIPITPPQILDFTLFNGGFFYVNASDPNGYTNYIDVSSYPVNDNSEIRLFDGLTEVLESGEQTVYPKYDLNFHECPCECIPLCDGEMDIEFNLNCGNTQTIRVRSSVQQGNYSLEGEAFNAVYPFKPVVRTKATYELVITDYTDEVYLLLMDLISDTDTIDIYDNISSPPYTNYIIDVEALTPNWNFNSKYGSITIPIIRTDSIKTKRRNCCD